MIFKNRTKKNLRILIGHQGDLSPEGTFDFPTKSEKDLSIDQFDLIVFEDA